MSILAFATPLEPSTFYVDGEGWVQRSYPSPIGPPARPWSYNGPWKVGDRVRLDGQTRGEVAGDHVVITAIRDAAMCPEYLSIADRAWYDRFEASIEYDLVFESPCGRAIHREWGGNTSSSSYAIHFHGTRL